MCSVRNSKGEIPMSHHNINVQRGGDGGLKPELPFRGFALQVLLSAALAFGLSASAAKANAYYVSPNGNNTDGLTYQTAFNELDQIKWNSLNYTGGLDLIIDGGTNGLVYHTALTVPAGASVSEISTSVDSGHSGVVYIDGTGSSSTSGINIIGSVNSLNSGSLANAITVRNWSGSGIQISGSIWGVLQGVKVEGNAVGLEVDGNCNALQFAIFHNNINNIQIKGALSQLTDAWIYQNYDISPKICTGLSISSLSNLTVSDCIFGPGLLYGAKASQAGTLSLNNCLLLNATGSNVLLTGASPNLTMVHCTSFMTKDNPIGGTHCCINCTNDSLPVQSHLDISSSIFWGGAVRIPVGQSVDVTARNIEYAVTGNTTALASTQKNPEFISNVASYPDNVSFETLRQSNFALQHRTHATPEGSSITSVSDLLKQF
jgi:hypothetical protein